MDMSECFGADDRIASSHDAIVASKTLRPLTLTLSNNKKKKRRRYYYDD